VTHLRSSGILGVIILITIINATAMAADEWPMYHHDLSLSGYSSSSGPDTNQILWIYNTGSAGTGGIMSSPAISGNMLYIGCTDQYLYDMNIVDGTLKWRYLSNGIINSSPAVYQNKVFFLTEAGTVYALDANTGAWSWQVNIGDGPYDWSSPAVYDSNVFIASSTGYVYSLKTSNGATNWSRYITGYPDGPLAVADGKVFLGTHFSDPALVALDVNTGEIIWQYISPYGGFVNSNGAAVADGDGDGRLELYFAVYNYQGGAVCLDLATGEYKWSTNIGPAHSTPAIHSGKLFIGSEDCSIYKLDAATGEILCSYQTQGQVWSSPAIINGLVYFGSLDHIVYAIDENNCNLIWSYNTQQSRLMGSPAVAYGAVFTGNENGKIYAFAKSLLTLQVTDDVNDIGCVIAGNHITYSICYNYTGDPNHPDNNNLIITDFLPSELNYLSSDGNYNDANRTVTWNLGPIRYITSGCVHLTVTVNSTAMPNHEIVNVVRAQNEYAEERTPVCPWTGALIYVDKKATTGLNNGTSWNNAFLDFNDALDEAKLYTGDPGGCEIWVAGGTYKPTVESENYAAATFRIPAGKVVIRGHFGGKDVNETRPSQRNFNNPAYETILDGRFNSYEWANYVVTCDNIGQGLTLDGLTFTGGSTAGLYINNSDPSITKCKFKGNGYYDISANNFSYPDVNDSNFLESSASQGTGIYSTLSSWPWIKNCVFDGNNQNLYGLQGEHSDMLVENCIVKRQSYNGMNFSNYSHFTVIGCKIENNGFNGIYSDGSDIEVSDCIIQGNYNNGVMVFNAPQFIISNSKICRNQDSGIYTESNTDSVIKNNWIFLNGDSSHDSGLYLKNSISPPFIRNNTIVKNAPYGVYIALGQDPCLINDIILQNGTGSAQDIFSENGIGGVYASYCCLENGFAGIGSDNIFCDPCFVSPDNNDFHLKYASLCIDAGDPYADYGDERDIDNQCRVAFGRTEERADIGGDEFAPKADYNKDSIVNFIDYAKLASKWRITDANISLDSNNIVNIYDLKLFCNDWLWHAPCSELYQSYMNQSQMSLIEQLGITEESADSSSGIVEEPIDDEQQSLVLDENQPPGIWLTCDGNMNPEYGDEVTVYVHSEPFLLAMDVMMEVDGDANVSAAMSTNDCNDYGWDTGWNTDPYIDPDGHWVSICGVSWNRNPIGNVGYFRFRYYSGQVTVYITDYYDAYDSNLEQVAFSLEPLVFGYDPNQ